MFDPLPPPRPEDRFVPGTAWMPPPASLYTRPKAPRKWLGPKGGLIILGALLVVWLYYVITDAVTAHGAGDTPTAVLVGGFAVGISFLYTMAYRLRPEDGLTPMRLVIAFGAGGLFATTFAGPINAGVDLLGGSNPEGDPSLLALSLAGVVEEAVKIALVIVVSRGLVNTSARNGLFIGGAVGFGFAAFEDMTYDVRAAHDFLFPHGPLLSYLSVSIGRGLIGPLEHPIYTALFAAVLFSATRNGRFRITPRVIGAYLAVALVHGLVDSGSQYVALLTHNQRLGDELALPIDIVIAIGAGVVWLKVSRRLRRQALGPPAQFVLPPDTPAPALPNALPSSAPPPAPTTTPSASPPSPPPGAPPLPAPLPDAPPPDPSELVVTPTPLP